MINCVLLGLTCTTLIALIIISAATSVSSADLQAEENNIPSRAQRNPRQIQSCNRVGLEKNSNFWKQHNQNHTFTPTELNFNEYGIVYASKSLKSNIAWVLDFVTNVWDYVHRKTTYQEAQRYKGKCLAVVIHEGKYPGDQHMYAINESNPFSTTNVLDIGSLTPNLWTDESKRNEAKDLITNQLAYFVEFSSNNKLGSPSSHIWKSPSSQGSAFVEIFTYDVYMNVQELNESALRYKNETLLKWHETIFPKNETFWFRDWFLPIYEKYGGTTVLNNYFNILAKNVPGYYYESDSPSKMNIGEFVHFWSGAARVDLAPLAWEAFGWTKTFQEELTEAQKAYRLKEPFVYRVTSGGEGRCNHFLSQLVGGFSLFCTLLAEKVLTALHGSI